jgi:hypothetical protein
MTVDTIHCMVLFFVRRNQRNNANKMWGHCWYEGNFNVYLHFMVGKHYCHSTTILVSIAAAPINNGFCLLRAHSCQWSHAVHYYSAMNDYSAINPVFKTTKFWWIVIARWLKYGGHWLLNSFWMSINLFQKYVDASLIDIVMHEFLWVTLIFFPLKNCSSGNPKQSMNWLLPC